MGLEVELVLLEVEVVCFEAVLETGRFLVTVIGRFWSRSACDDEDRGCSKGKQIIVQGLS